MHDCWPISLKRSIQLCAPYLTNKPENLLQWVQRRHQLVEMLTAERNRLRAMSGSARADIETHIDWLEKRLVRLDEELERLIADNPVWKDLSTLLCSVPGVGPVVSATLIANLPELGNPIA
jgi:transposase